MLRLAVALFTSLLLVPAIATAQPSAAAPSGSAPDGGELVTITLRDGQLLRGHIVAETAAHVIINLVSGGEMAVANSQIRSIKRNDETVFVSGDNEIYKHDPNRTRYLYGPSALMLRQGEGYFSQTELLVSTIGYGVTDNLTISAGSVIPFLFADDGANFILGARIGSSLSEHFHIAGGINSLVLPDLGVIGIASGQLTIGTPRAHFTLSAGKPFVLSDDETETGPVILSASGNVRISKHLAFITENWVLPDDGETYHLLSGAARFMGEHIAVDVGFLLVEDGEIPIPWLDFTWNWD